MSHQHDVQWWRNRDKSLKWRAASFLATFFGVISFGVHLIVGSVIVIFLTIVTKSPAMTVGITMLVEVGLLLILNALIYRPVQQGAGSGSTKGQMLLYLSAMDIGWLIGGLLPLLGFASMVQ